MGHIAVIGGGKIGEALVAGLLAAGREPGRIRVVNRRPERGNYLHRTYHVGVSDSIEEVVDGADAVFICTKPKDVTSVLADPALQDIGDDVAVVSMAAGITIATLEEALSAGTSVFRAMPNTPMLISKGVTALAPGRFTTEQQLDYITEILESVGIVVVVDEADMDAVTAVAGSSPAYVFLLAEALIDSGVSLGLSRELASTLALASISGAADLMEQSSSEPSVLRANVSSPAGTTVAAVESLESSGFRAAFFKATRACAERSAQIGRRG